jgi:hypothetical protein
MRNPDLFSEWTGLWRGSDSLGGLHYGVRTRLEAGRRIIDYWYFDTRGDVAVETYSADNFEVVNLYALNYGSYEPTWIYRYTVKGTDLPVFEVREYYDGSYEAWLTADAGPPDEAPSEGAAVSFERCVKPLLSEAPLERIEEYPKVTGLEKYLARVTPEGLSSVLDGLPGRYFRIKGVVEATSRSHYDAYEAFSQFPEGFRETVALRPISGPGGLLTPTITTPLIPCDSDEEDWKTLPSPFGEPREVEGAEVACIARYKRHQRDALVGPGAKDYTLRFELVRMLP